MNATSCLKRALAALLSGVLLCGGLSACTPAGNGTGTSSTAATTGSNSRTETPGTATASDPAT